MWAVGGVDKIIGSRSVRILAITKVKFDDSKDFYIDELKKIGNNYCWDEVDVDSENFNDSSLFYFIGILSKSLNDDCSYDFKDKHFRFTTTIKKLKKKYSRVDGISFHF